MPTIRRLPLALSALLALGALSPAQAQVEPEMDTVTVRPGLPEAPPISPGSAFLRSIVLPAWGHASIDSGRGVFYTFAEAGSAWMLLRVNSRLSSARSELAVREASARATAIAGGITDEAEIQAAIAADEDVQDGVRRVNAREGQQEDWIAALIFSVLISGVDAYVSTHLKDFPAPLSTGFRQSPWGGWELVGSLGLPRGW